MAWCSAPDASTHAERWCSHGGRSLVHLQELVDGLLEGVEGERPAEAFDGLDLRPVGRGIPEEERWRGRHPGVLARLKTRIDRRGVGPMVQTGLEGRHVQPQGLGMLPQCLGLQA